MAERHQSLPERASSPQWTFAYRSLLSIATIIIGALLAAQYSTLSATLDELKILIAETRADALQARNDNDLQNQIIEIINARIADQEIRIRGLEGWQRQVNAPPLGQAAP